jgi:mycothiol synthase
LCPPDAAPALRLRPPRAGDEPAILEVLNAAIKNAYGVDDSSSRALGLYMESPRVDPERDIRVAEDGDGRLVAYGDVYEDEDGGGGPRYWGDVRLLPTAPEAAADLLLAWLEERVGAAPLLRVFLPSRIERVKRALERHGYHLIRHSYRMQIALDPPPPEPEWPAGIDVRIARPGEERALYEVHEECFSDHWEHVRESFEEWAHWLVQRDDHDPTLWFVPTEGEEIVGYALCFPNETEPDMGSIAILGVRRPWRRRGVGRALLLHAFAELRRRGFARAGLGVDAESLTGANRLYEKAGMHVVRRMDVYER